MARGQPDFGMYAAKTVTANLSDMAELAARLGSIVTFDRRGDVIFLEDFEAPILNWTGEGDGVDDEQRLYPDKAYMGSQCVYLQTSGTTDDESYIVRRFFLTPNQCYGLEARVKRVTTDARYEISMWLCIGGKVYKAKWQYDAPNNRLLFWDSTGNLKVKATEIDAGTTFEEWWPIKLVIDSLTLKYVRAIFLGTEYDLSDESMEEDDTVVPDGISLYATVITPADAQRGAFYDNIIITQNEP